MLRDATVNTTGEAWGCMERSTRLLLHIRKFDESGAVRVP
jgi:hypothetical protein